MVITTVEGMLQMKWQEVGKFSKQHMTIKHKEVCWAWWVTPVIIPAI